MLNFKTEVEAADALAEKYAALKKEIAKVIIGQDEVIDRLLIALFCKGHALLCREGVVRAGVSISRTVLSSI